MPHDRRHGALRQSMADGRSGEVVFVSHCLLNQNTRYLGGAGCPGAVAAAIAPYLENGTGIVQLPCPEQAVWGGVLKTRMLWLIEHSRAARVAAFAVPVVRSYLRRRYARQARAVARELGDYLDSGLSVRGIVGVAGSPTCGVHTTLDLKRALGAMAERGSDRPTAEWMNAVVIDPALRPGRGVFIEELVEAVRRRRADVPIVEEPIALSRRRQSS